MPLGLLWSPLVLPEGTKGVFQAASLVPAGIWGKRLPQRLLLLGRGVGGWLENAGYTWSLSSVGLSFPYVAPPAPASLPLHLSFSTLQSFPAVSSLFPELTVVLRREGQGEASLPSPVRTRSPGTWRDQLWYFLGSVAANGKFFFYILRDVIKYFHKVRKADCSVKHIWPHYSTNKKLVWEKCVRISTSLLTLVAGETGGRLLSSFTCIFPLIAVKMFLKKLK